MAIKKTVVSFILDETGSMESCKSQTISGFNEYIKTLKKTVKGAVSMTLTKFNSDKIDIVYANKALKDIKEMSDKDYQPNNLTPLYDAIGKTILELEKKARKSDKVLMVILTDGFENHSKDYDRTKIFSMVEAKKKEGWTFAFLGANIDAFAEGAKMGISSNMNFNTRNIKATMSSLAASTAYFCNSANTTRAHDFFNNGEVKKNVGKTKSPMS